MQRNPEFHHKLFKFLISLNILDYIAYYFGACLTKFGLQMDSQIILSRECKIPSSFKPFILGEILSVINWRARKISR